MLFKDAGPSRLLLLLLAVSGVVASTYGSAPALSPANGPATGSEGRGRNGPEPQRARGADDKAGGTMAGPIPIDKRSWWAVIKGTLIGFNDDRLMTEAAGVTFYTLLALFPAIATMVSLFGLFADPRAVNDQLAQLNGVIPSGGLSLISEQVKALTSNGSQALGFGVLLGLLTSLWTANQGIKSIFDALNVVYHEKEKRSYFRRTLISLCFTLGAIVFILLAIGAVVVVPIVLNDIGFGDYTAQIIAAARWPGLMVLLALFLSLVFRFGPSRDVARWQWISWGSAFSAVTWLLASLGFSYYVANFGSYNKTYGSLGAVVGFITWIWISAMIILLGGELNAELERQTPEQT